MRRIGLVNWIGVQTLCAKEIQRFLKVALQTVIAPAITTLLFMAIFLLAFGAGGRTIAGMPFGTFLAPGLVMMAIIQNSFANTTSSILISKVQGNIIDVLMPPLNERELTFCFAVGGVCRGVAVALAVSLPMALITPIHLHHIGALVYFGLSAALLLSLVGILTGVWARKFDHAASVTNFVIMPLSFLSGTFYSIRQLPEIWQQISLFNPFFYMIDGFRYAFTGHADGDLTNGVLYILALNAVLWMAAVVIFRSGYNLKS